MKRLFILMVILLTLLFSVGWGSYPAGLVTTSDNLRFPVIAVDDTGMVADPDSGAVIVWFEGEAGADTSSYTYAWTTAGATDAVIDSLRLVSKTVYYFIDQVADVDDGQGEGNYSGVVILYTDGQPFYNNFSFELYDSERETILDEIAWILDSIQNHDDWVAHQTTSDSLYDSLLIVLDSLEVLESWVAKEATVQIIDDSVDAWDDNIAEILDILDTLQNQDDWVANATEVAKVIDSLADVLDSLETISTWMNTRIDSLLKNAEDGAITATKIAADAIGVSEIASAVYEETWRNIDTTNIDSSELGEWFSTGISASISNANMGAIADSVYDKDTADAFAFAGGFGKFVKDSTQGAAAAEIADTAKNRYFGDTTFAYILNAPDYLSIPNDTASCTKDTSVGVHPTVVFIADSIGVASAGSLSVTPQYTFVMGYTPFGGGSGCGTYKENPCVVGSNNGDDWEIPHYVDTAGDTTFCSTPLVDTSYFHCQHMSDIKLLHAQDTVYCYYRVNWGTSDSTGIYCQTSVDLVNWSDTIRVRAVGAGTTRLLSPVAIEESDGSFTLIYLDDSTGGGTDPQLVKLNSTEPAVAFDTLTTIDTLIYAESEPGRVPWHIDIERYGTFYHAFVTERISGGADYSNHFAVSANGTTYVAKYEPILKVGDPGQWDDNILYKMCGIPNNNNIEPFYDVYYSAQSASGDGEYHIGRSRLRFSPRPDANLYAISGDMKAANDLENLFDGNRHVTLHGDIDGYVLPGRFNNLLTNGDFETDSVDNNTAPNGWTFTDSAFATTWAWCRSVNDNFAIDTWRYFMKNHVADTLRLTQRLYLDRGIYVLSGYLKIESALNKMGLAISNQDSLPNAGFTDSIFVSSKDIFKRYTMQFTVSDADSYSVGVVFQTSDAYEVGYVDDVKLQRIRYDSDPFGSGGAMVTHYAYDSANSAMVSGVTFAVRTLAGTDWAKITTGSGGAGTYNARVNDTLVVTGFLAGYTWPADTIIIASSSHTDSTQGYAVLLGSPSGADLCRVYADFSLQGGEMTEGVTLVATKIGVNLKDTCQPAWFTDYVYTSAPSDSNGRAFVDVIKSKCLNEEDGGANSPWYIFEAFLDGQAIMRPIRDSVPDLDSMRVY